jgi:hypothetical protein
MPTFHIPLSNKQLVTRKADDCLEPSSQTTAPRTRQKTQERPQHLLCAESETETHAQRWNSEKSVRFFDVCQKAGARKKSGTQFVPLTKCLVAWTQRSSRSMLSSWATRSQRSKNRFRVSSILESVWRSMIQGSSGSSPLQAYSHDRT